MLRIFNRHGNFSGGDVDKSSMGIEEVYKDEFEGLSEFLEYNNIEDSLTERELNIKKRIWSMSNPEILMFTSDHCGGCKTAKNQLNGAGIEIKEVNVEDHEGHVMAMQYGIQGGLPTFVVTQNGSKFEGWHGSVESFKNWLVDCNE